MQLAAWGEEAQEAPSFALKMAAGMRIKVVGFGLVLVVTTVLCLQWSLPQVGRHKGYKDVGQDVTGKQRTTGDQ